jgi:DNA-directed RNA polymerase subunit M/transcription elongation factor TFIIS
MSEIANLLTKIKGENGSQLVNKQDAINLANLTFRDGENILTLDDTNFLYEIIWLLSKVGYEKTYNFLSVDWEKVFGSNEDVNVRRKILFENPLMEKARDKFLLDMEIYRTKIEVEAGEKCPKCGSNETISAERQIRSCDEAATIFVYCISCSFKWRAQ